MKKVLATTLMALSIPLGVYAQECNLVGSYDVKYDFTANGKLDGKVTEKRANFKPNKNDTASIGHYAKSDGKDVLNSRCGKREKSVLAIVQQNKSNGYVAVQALQESSDGRYVGTWYDVQGNAGDIVYEARGGGDPTQSKYLKIGKTAFSTVKDGVVKVSYKLPGFEYQRICVEKPQTPKEKPTNCRGPELSRQKSGAIDLYVPSEPGTYELRVYFADDSVNGPDEASQRAWMAEQTIFRDTLKFQATK